MPFLSSALLTRAEAPALITSGSLISYRALSERAERVARQLVTLGVGPGSVVALKGHPDPETITAIHGIWKAGCALATLNPRWTLTEEARALEQLCPRVVLVGEDLAPPGGGDSVEHVMTLGEGRRAGRVEPIGSLWPDTGGLPPVADPRVWDSKVAAVLFTSGTAGTPGMVSLTFGNLRASAEGARERLKLLPDDRWLASLSLAHVGGLALVSRSAHLGSGLLLKGPFTARGFASMVAKGALSHASLVPTMLHQFLEVWGDRPAPETLRCLLIGGAHAEKALLTRALKLDFPLALTYGLTEASSQVATAPPDLVREKPGTVGHPLRGIEVSLTSESELLVRGPTVSAGQVEADGWLKTGDLAHRDPEGHIWVTGRLSDRIVSGGVNVDPGEVEAVIRAHPGVDEVAVVGLKDPKWGERVVAAVVANGGADLDLGELDRLTRATLSPAKRPREIRLIAVLPRNANGKVDRRAVQALLS